MRFCEIGMPILPTPTKPMVCALISSDLDRLIGKIDLEPERALHDRPFLELECAQAVGDEGIGLGKSARLLRIRSAQDGQAGAVRRTGAVAERSGGEHQTAL